MELYGPWQTRAWAPPAAQNGIVPRNDHGNVEVPPFAAAVPVGTVYIDLPRAAAVAAQLEVDAAPALVGFEPGRQGGMVPKIRGVVVCAEHADAVREAAQAAEQARQEKQRQKRCAAVPWPRPSQPVPAPLHSCHGTLQTTGVAGCACVHTSICRFIAVQLHCTAVLLRGVPARVPALPPLTDTYPLQPLYDEAGLTTCA